MEDRTESPIAVKVEEHTQYVILTYFQGDISSMVDAHFTRALGKVGKASSPALKAKKMRKTIKLEDVKSCPTGVVDAYTDSQVPPAAGHLLSFSPADMGSSSWSSPGARLPEGPAIPSFAYSLPSQGLSLTGQQYASSLLNLLHDRNEVGPSMASGSKPDLLPSWSMPQGFVEPEAGFEHDRRLDKKNLYWY
ncbi:transcription cofactor vestigial-like protein 1 [Betta splendens]|uniref:Transcription cofactor vestigial-like protein 1 n=1 Tax=Betta splendens TaxID=158456 RepID=A0A6P7NPS7_BETSP|nr:transcription cofactor vestigial-like protein 1 [Betta splendens]